MPRNILLIEAHPDAGAGHYGDAQAGAVGQLESAHTEPFAT